MISCNTKRLLWIIMEIVLERKKKLNRGFREDKNKPLNTCTQTHSFPSFPLFSSLQKILFPSSSLVQTSYFPSLHFQQFRLGKSKIKRTKCVKIRERERERKEMGSICSIINVCDAVAISNMSSTR